MSNIKISGIEKFSMVDYGEKIACTIFTEGCNFRCPFCHNAALVLPQNKQPVIPEEEIIDYLTKRKGLVDGVCVTGGEPTLHKGLEEFLVKVKALDYPVKLDTNGTRPDVIQRLYEKGLIDYVAMDIKNSLKKYAFTAGMESLETDKIKQSTAYLMSSGIDYEFRTTLVDGFHDESDIQEIGFWLKGAKQFYLQKFIDSGGCLSEGLSEVPLEKALSFKRLLLKYIRRVDLRGYA